ncbi:MAG: excinuclease ABC subunit UvrC [Myxococcales bacterium]|nr:excinuclease ABC subunit UvrC [Myxococcales bacterium]
MKLANRILQIPEAPGVYLMKDRHGEVVYIGKAANLRARLRSYLGGGDGREFTRHIDRFLDDVETLITANEKEALLLENQLIKTHQPRFNIRLKDDKNFLKLRISHSHPYPRVEPVRRVKKDGARYFGPYHSASALRNTLQTLNRHFQLRTCSDNEFKNRSRPCLQYQIKRCLAPCVLEVERESYRQLLDNAALFLEGKPQELLDRLQSEMREAADSWNYEHAAALRDRIAAIARSFQSQHVELGPRANLDCLGVHREGALIEIQLLSYRRGQLSGTQSFGYDDQRFPTEELLGSFLGLYYADCEDLPDELLLPLDVEERETLAVWLGERRGKKVRVHVPRSGAKAKLVELAVLNARNNLADERRRHDRARTTLDELREKLELPRIPLRIECFDNSNFGGREPVSSKVSFFEGKPDRSGYRHYRLRHPEYPNDFAMMAEVLQRRLERGLADDDLPDLIVVDGGKGQLSAALEVLEALGLRERVELRSLAKARSAAFVERRGRHHTRPESAAEGALPERVFRPGDSEPVVLDTHSDALFLIQRLRDEAHRFAISYHRKLRRQKNLTSPLDAIPGVGKKRRLALLWHFGSLTRVREASVEQLRQCPGIHQALAETIRAHFHPSREH